jgi:hypothetical protein
MKRGMTGVLKITGSLAVAGGMIMMAAMPAVAAAPNLAYAAGATGPISVSPLGEATFPGKSPVTLVNADITGLLTTGVVTDTATATSASSSVADVSATISAAVSTLSATAVDSSCSYSSTTGTVTGSTTITDGAVTLLGSPTITLDASPAPNTSIAVDDLATVTLNRQTVAADGTLTVTAIYISLVGSLQTLSLGVSTCNMADLPVAMLPSKAMPFALGGLGVLLIAGASYGVVRRRRYAPAA